MAGLLRPKNSPVAKTQDSTPAHIPTECRPAKVRPRRRPSQQRSEDTVEAILTASAQLFARLGYAGATTNKIAQRAGVSVGSLYQYFPNKDALLAALMESHGKEVGEVVKKALHKLADPKFPLEASLRQLVEGLYNLHKQDPDLTEALSLSLIHQSSAIHQANHIGHEPGQTEKVAAILKSRPDVRPGNHQAMAAVLSQTVSHLTRWLVHETPDATKPLCEEVIQMLLRYLQNQPPTTRTFP